MTFDPATGDVFVGGAISDSTLPNHSGGAQPGPATGSGDDDGYVLRIHSSLAFGAFVQSTYFGGSGFEAVRSMVFRASTGDVIVAGDTHSTDLPFVAGGAQASKLGSSAVPDGFVVRLPASLTVAGQASYVGGSNSSAYAVTLTPTGDVIVGGYTAGANLPGRAGGLQPAMVGSDDGFLSRLNGGLTSFVQSTYLGGTAQGDVILALEISPANGGLYAAGTTVSMDFPGTAGGANPTHTAGTSSEGFVARLTVDLLPALRIAQSLKLDEIAAAGTVSDLDKVFEKNETAVVAPSWKNVDTSAIALTGTATALTGPAGAVYTINDGTASYGSVAPGAIADCSVATGDCYRMTVTAAARPVAHWDATFTETLSDGTPKTWALHLGDSFADVPRGSGFYRFIEKVFHNGVTSGCGGGNYCPGSSVTRAQMSVFLLVSKDGAAYTPPPAAGIFADVPASNGFAKWIEELFHRGVTAGCGGGNYCPSDSVTRAQMAVFLLVTKEGSGYTPPPATGLFLDVPASSGFAKWIEELVNRGITAGCGGGNYCPNSAATRGQMAVFLVATFGLGF